MALGTLRLLVDLGAPLDALRRGLDPLLDGYGVVEASVSDLLDAGLEPGLVEVIEEIPVECGEIIELRYAQAPCPSRSPASALSARSARSVGPRTIVGEMFELVGRIKERGISIILIEHVMRFLVSLRKCS